MMTLVLMILSALQAAPAHAGPDDTAYFNQFLFQKESIGADPDFPEYQYRWLMTTGMVTFLDANQNTILASVDLQLYPDGHYELRYSEMIKEVMPGAPAGTAPVTFPHGCKFLKGAWSVPDTSLVIENIGNAVRAYDASTYPPQEVSLTFGQDILSPGLANLSSTMSYGIGNTADLSQDCFNF